MSTERTFAEMRTPCACPSCTPREPFYAQYLLPPILQPMADRWMSDDETPMDQIAPDAASSAHTISALVGAPGAKAGMIGTTAAVASGTVGLLGLSAPMWSSIGVLGGLLLGIAGLIVNWRYKERAAKLDEKMAEARMRKTLIFTPDDE